MHQYLPYNGSTIGTLSGRGIPILAKRQHYWFLLKRRNISYCNTGNCYIAVLAKHLQGNSGVAISLCIRRYQQLPLEETAYFDPGDSSAPTSLGIAITFGRICTSYCCIAGTLDWLHQGDIIYDTVQQSSAIILSTW